METEESTIDLQKPPKKEQVYFWNKISFDTIQKAIMVLAMILACLPVFVSLTVKPWIFMLRGEEGVKNCYYIIVGQYWYSLVYIVIAVMGCVMVMGAMQKYRLRSVCCICNKKWILSHWLSANMFLLLLWSLISFCFAKDKQSGVWGDYYCHEGILMYFFYGILFLSGSWLNKKQMKSVTEVLVGICAFTGFLILIEDTFLEWMFYIENNEMAMFHNRNHYGYYLTICAPLAIGLALQDTKLSKIMRLGRWLEIWLIFNALMACNTRGCFLAVILTLLFWNIYICILKKGIKRKLYKLDVFILLTILLLNTGTFMGSRLSEIVNNFLLLFSSGDKQKAFDRIGSSRGILWRLSFQFSLEKPILGYGPANLIEPFFDADAFTSCPHNDLFLILVSMGYPALIFYLSGLTAHLVGFFKYVKTMSVFEVTMYASVASYLISSFFGVSMYYTAPYYFLMLGFSYGVYKMHVKEAADVKLAAETGNTEN